MNPSISSSTTSSSSRPADLSARLISDVPLVADVLTVGLLPYSSPSEGIHIILASSPSTWVKLAAAGTAAKLYESLETLGNIKAQIGIARKASLEASSLEALSRSTKASTESSFEIIGMVFCSLDVW